MLIFSLSLQEDLVGSGGFFFLLLLLFCVLWLSLGLREILERENDLLSDCGSFQWFSIRFWHSEVLNFMIGRQILSQCPFNRILDNKRKIWFQSWSQIFFILSDDEVDKISEIYSEHENSFSSINLSLFTSGFSKSENID